jgi:cytochrome c biogenesis protein CcdA
VFNGPFALAITAGMVATVNPCGFALLPAYLSAFVGLQDRPGRLGSVGRALAVSAVLTAGFVTVFGLLGMVFSSALEEVQQYAPWFTIVFGLLVAGIGIWLLSGRDLVLSLPKLERGGTDGTLPSMYLFGVSYAIASLSCAIAPFLVVTSSASNADNFASRVLTFVLYGVGMGLVITVLTVALALARSGVVARFRELLPVMSRIAGALMVVTGAYVAYYGYYELRLLNYGGDEDDWVIDTALRIQTRLAELMPNTGNYGWYVLAAVVLIALAITWAMRGSGPRDETGVSDPEPETRDRSHSVTHIDA